MRMAAFKLAFPLALLSGSALADCGTVSIAGMSWQSGEIAAELDKFILTEGYGCDAQIVSADTITAFTSMIERGEPSIVPEAWENVAPKLMQDGIREGRVVELGPILLDGGLNGWFMPRYIQEAHPDIKTVADALAHPELFPSPEDPSKGGFYGAPSGWGAATITSQLFKAFGFSQKGFELIDPGSSAGLDSALLRAYENRKGWLGYYYSPTGLLAKVDMVKVDFGVPEDREEWTRCTSVADCPDPKPNAWPVERVTTMVSKTFADAADPAVIGYLKARSWSNDTLNSVMAWTTDNQGTGKDGALHFLQTRSDLWKAWVGPEVAARIEAAL